MPEVNLNFSKKVLITVIISAIVISLFLFLGFVVSILLLIFAGILLAVLLRALSRVVQKFIPVSENISLLIVVILLILILTGLGFIMGPNLSEGISNLADKLPSSIEKLEETISHYSWGRAIINNINNATDNISNDPKITSRITGIFSSALTGIANIVIILIVGLYGAYDPKLYTENFLLMVPKNKKKRVSEIIDHLENALVWWMVGRFSSMAVVGILTMIGLWILGIPLAFTLGFIAAVLSFVPNIGPVISAVPAVLLGLMESPTKAVYVIILYIVIQTIESYMVTPMIQKRAVSLPPAVLISVQIIIGVLLGAFGLVLATPLMVVVIVLVQTIYVQDILGYEVPVLGEKNH